LAGAIEHAPDGGSGWRAKFREFLITCLGLEAFDPCVQEIELLTREEKHNLRNWKKTDPERFRLVIRKFVENDLDHLVNRTLFVVCFWDEYAARGAGTAGEVTVSYLYRIPLYLVAGRPVEEIPGWILACATEIFDDFAHLQARLLERYSQRLPFEEGQRGRNFAN
jgi:hypothetical protein